MKAVLLARVSSREQENGQSIDAQVENLKRYCASNGLEVLKLYQITESSTQGERKKFKEMLKFVGTQRQKVALVADCVDRVQRGFKESVELNTLRENGRIEIHFIREGLRLDQDSRSSDIVMWDMSVLMAKTYIANMRDNIKRSMNYNRSHGVWQSTAPMGYLNARDNNHNPTLILDLERAVLIRKVFEAYATGLYTLSSLTEYANHIGLRSKNNLHPIRKSTIAQIISRPFYHGEMVYRGQLVPHKYDKIITKDLFNKCQAVLRGKGRKQFKYGQKPFVFRGLIKCADCGCTISSDKKTKSTGKTYTYLFCSHFKGNCKQKPVNERLVLEQIENEVLAQLSFPRSLLNELHTCLQDTFKAKNAAMITKRNSLDAQYTANKGKISRLLDLLIENNISQADYDMKKAELEAQQRQIENDLAALAGIDKTILISAEYVANLAARSCELFNSSKVDTKRQILNLLLSNCTLKDGKLLYSLNKPFDLLLKTNGRINWLGRTDSNHDKENQNLLSYH